MEKNIGYVITNLLITFQHYNYAKKCFLHRQYG